jgi:hypothetical protein
MIVAAVVAVLLAPPLLGLLVVSFVEVGDARGDIDAAEAGDGQRALSRADELVDRLEDERAWWALELLGFTNAVDPGPLVDAESPQRTDRAIAELRAVITDGTDDEGDLAPLAAAVDGLTDLGEVRRDAEEAIAAPGGGTAASTPTVQALSDTYAESVDAILDAADVVISGFDDPQVRHGAHVQLTASGQLKLTDELGRELLLSAVGDGLTTAEGIARLAETDGRWRAGLAELEAAPAPYDALVREHLPDERTAPVMAHADQALSSGTVDLTVVLADLETAVTGLAGLEDAVAERRAGEVQEVIDSARDREQRFLVLGGVAFAGVVTLAAVATVLVVSARSRPPSGPPSDHAPGMGPPPPPPLVVDHA